MTLTLVITFSQSDTCLSFHIKFSKVGSSRYREPGVEIANGLNHNERHYILLPRENEWFHIQVNRSSGYALFFLAVFRPNFTIGLDNVSTDCSPGKRKYAGPFTSFRTLQSQGFTSNEMNDF